MAGDPRTAGEVWLVLHGYGQLASRFLRRFGGLPGLASGRRAVVAPEALSRFYVERSVGEHGPESRVGASWMTREAREAEIGDYVAYLDAVVSESLSGRPTGLAPAGLIALGFSQGAETVSRWAAYGTTSLSELVLWGGGVAADLDMARASRSLAGTRIRFVVGDSDGWALRRSAESMALLSACGLSAERMDYAGGHRIEPDVLASRWPG